jgi:uncharacterized protein (UPF0335 family)
LQNFQTAADKALSNAATSQRDYDVLASRTRAAIAMLRRHEAEENEMIMNAYWDDLGGQG